MASKRPKGKSGSQAKGTSPAKGPWPDPNLTARQQRTVRREADRAAARNSTGPNRNSILLITGIVAIIAIVVVAAAYVATRPSSDSGSIAAINPPTAVTPSTVPQTGRTLGDPNAPATLVIWGDFRCSACLAFTLNTEPQLVTNFVETGKLKIEYQDFLSIDIGQGNSASRDAANAALCAADEGKFWTMHDWLFANQAAGEAPSAFTIDRLLAIGKDAGLSDAIFQSCVKNGTHDGVIATEAGAVPAGVTGTPGLILNGKLVTSSAGANFVPTYAEIAAAINAIPAVASPAPSAS
jgi:protein-disulfide isomerase